jgi:hypothetical protein
MARLMMYLLLERNMYGHTTNRFFAALLMFVVSRLLSEIKIHHCGRWIASYARDLGHRWYGMAQSQIKRNLILFVNSLQAKSGSEHLRLHFIKVATLSFFVTIFPKGKALQTWRST